MSINAWLIFLFVFIVFTMMLILPFLALADMKPVYSQPKQRCGLKCVVETMKFDTLKEAQEWANNHKPCTEPYQFNGVKDVWFVDYQVTELEASLL